MLEIERLVEHFINSKELFSRLLINLEGYIVISKTLTDLIHSTKYRIKDPEHLRDKLIRKAITSIENDTVFDITQENLFSKINDLAGFRIIHLHTRQIEEIDNELKRIFNEERWQIIEGPTARTWDEESSRYFEKIGFQIHPSPNLNMYTSVHYVIQPNSSSSITCEIQVRTLMEEVWGEVDHSINYPHRTESLSCREQIKALARATSSCSSLVDSIFSTYNDYKENWEVRSLSNRGKEYLSLKKPNKKEISKIKVDRPKNSILQQDQSEEVKSELENPPPATTEEL